MAETTVEVRPILDAAEQAASVQDFASAERFLRQAATLQEAQLGATHPDLANTLNNLGIVCERTGNTSEAESCYRRAYAIAQSTLAAEDPLLLTSGQNLREFCAATGKPFELVATPPKPPAPAPPAPVAPAPPAPVAPKPPAPVTAAPRAPVTAAPRTPVSAAPPAAVAAAPSASVPFAPRTPPASPSSPRIDHDTLRTQIVNVAAAAVSVEAKTRSRHWSAIWVVLGSAIVLALIILFADRMSRSSESPPAAPGPSPAETPAPAEQPPAPTASAPQPTGVAPAAGRSAVAAAAKPPSVPATRTASDKGPTPTSSATVSLVESQLCRSLSNWQCSPATNPAEPGLFIFYTRVKSARDTTVQHRWYLNGDLRRSVDLRVGANSSEGYRTFSRNTVAAERRGNWTIEVRDAGGALLHEERFLVQ